MRATTLFALAIAFITALRPLASNAAATTAAITATHSHSITVTFASGVHADLAAGWLRERSLEPDMVQPFTFQPTNGFHEGLRNGAAALEVKSAHFEGQQDETLVVAFADKHVARYSASRLAEELAAPRSRHQQVDGEHTTLPRRLWNASLLAPPQFQHADLIGATPGISSEDAKLDLLTQLLSTGQALIRNVPSVDGEVVRFGELISAVRRTDWGTLFNVRTVPDDGTAPVGEEGSAAAAADAEAEAAAATATVIGKADLAYSSTPISFHTDNPYRSPPPDYQLLHALKHCSCPDHELPPPCASCGVMNFAVDGVHVAELLRAEDPEGFELLATIPARFESNCGDGASSLVRYAPLLELEADVGSSSAGGVGECNRSRSSSRRDDDSVAAAACHTKGRSLPRVRAINFSPKSGGYIGHLPVETATRYYEARRRFAQLLHDPANTITFQLAKGDLWIFDNTRVLHARGPMGKHDPERWLQGAYVDRALLWYHWQKWRKRRATMNGDESNDRLAPGGAFTALSDGTKDELVAMGKVYQKRVDGVSAESLLRMLTAQRGDRLGQPIDLFEHGVQTATRALRAGEPDEVVVISLLHDITETIVSKNHGSVIAALLEPFISPQSQWLLRQHEVFQGKFYFHHFGGDPNTAEKLWGTHEFYKETARWCLVYDQMSFDPTYPNLPLSAFTGALDRVLAKTPYWWNPQHPKRMAVTGV